MGHIMEFFLDAIMVATRILIISLYMYVYERRVDLADMEVNTDPNIR